MVHSIELVFDPDTEAAVRAIWDELARVGLRSLAGHSVSSDRPHVTLTVADEIDEAVNAALGPAAGRLPLECTIGAPMLFGRRQFTLVRLLVPSAELLSLHAEIDRLCSPYMPTGPMPNAVPGHWTPHVTFARRLAPERLPSALALKPLTRDLRCSAVGLRHWDGNAKREYLIS